MQSYKNVLVYADGRPESSLAIVEALRFAEHAEGKASVLTLKPADFKSPVEAEVATAA